MAEEMIEILVTPERTMLDNNNIRNSTGKTSTSNSRKKIVPHYLRASTGSCHDFCKYGRKIAFEAVGNRHIPRRIATTMINRDEKLNVAIVSARKKKTSTKLRPSLDMKTWSPSSSETIKHEASPFGKKKVASVKQVLSPAERTEVSLSQPSSPAGNFEVSLTQALLPAKKLEVSPELAPSPAKKIEVARKHVLLPSKKIDVSSKHALFPGKKIEVSQKQVSATKKIEVSPKQALLLAKKIDVSRKEVSAAKRVEVSPKQAVLLAKKIEVSRKQVSAAKKVEVSPKQALLPAKKIEVYRKQVSATKEIEVSPKQALLPAKKIDVSQMQALSPAKKTEISPKQALLSTKKTEVSQKQVLSPAKKLEASRKQIVSSPKRSNNCANPEGSSEPKFIAAKRSLPSSLLGGIGGKRNGDRNTVKKIVTPRMDEKKMLRTPIASVSPTPSMLSTPVSQSVEADSSPKIRNEAIEAEPMLSVQVTENTLYVGEQPESNSLVPDQSGSHTNQLSAPSSSSSLSSPLNPLSSPSSPLLSMHGEPLNSLSFPSSPLLSIHGEEEDPVSDYDETENEESDSMLGEAEDSISEYDETENEDQVEASTVLYKKPAKEGGCPENTDCIPRKLSFNRGQVVSLPSENSGPRRLRFRRGRVLGENDVKGDTGRKRIRRREVTRVKADGTEPESEKVVLRHQDVQGKKDAQGLFNNVIEETASKLVESRKSKVKALVGAFETVISLQDLKPSTD